MSDRFGKRHFRRSLLALLRFGNPFRRQLSGGLDLLSERLQRSERCIPFLGHAIQIFLCGWSYLGSFSPDRIGWRIVLVEYQGAGIHSGQAVPCLLDLDAYLLELLLKTGFRCLDPFFFLVQFLQAVGQLALDGSVLVERVLAGFMVALDVVNKAVADATRAVKQESKEKDTASVSDSNEGGAKKASSESEPTNKSRSLEL